MKITDKIFGTHSQREIKRINDKVDAIEALAPQMKELSDEQLRAKTDEFKKRLADGETLDDLLVEAFAVVREAAVRAIGLYPFRVQLIGGIILHQGRVAEMKTGEGKTLVAVLPSYLNALEGKGVNIITVNDYLAKRDATLMGQIHAFLGLTTGCVLNSMESDERREQYACDITYVTNNEIGFDYLRDNMVVYKEQLVLRELNFAIIDEADSVLIDEARTGADLEDQSKMDMILGIEQEETGDFIVNEKDKAVNLTAEGVKKVEQFFKIENLADPENIEIQHNVILALRAHNLMFRDQDYVVKDDQIVIVDSFTGRLMPGRRYSDGLHQAIEAKEHVKVKRESKTLATITFQNFFNKFKKKAGMTGTALTEEKEFREIYGMDVIEIPTNVPVIRIDENDAVYKTKNGKLNAICHEVEECHKKGQPVLVGTITIDASEELSRRLQRRGIQHKVLNAKFHEMEAQIVAEAGQKGAVTIATNMAGRGTDIKLGEGVPELGGLRIIGTERHESRRIDNQLRGRSGRQGDPGSSKFFISLEDDLMRLFASDRLMTIFNSLGVSEDQEISHKMLSRAVENAQKRIENNNFGIRKALLEYDQVNNDQREIIYAERNRVLNGDSMRDTIYKWVIDVVENAVDSSLGEDSSWEDWDLNELNMALRAVVPLEPLTPEKVKGLKKNALKQMLKEEAVKLYEEKEAQFPDPEIARETERIVLLKAIDQKWMNHIDDMEQLKQGIGMVAYAQKDPKVEYRMTGFDMFDAMTEAIKEQTVFMMMHVVVEKKIEREQVAQVTGTNKDDTVVKGPKRRTEDKIYPNSPCPCGSGKKYKNCHGRNL